MVFIRVVIDQSDFAQLWQVFEKGKIYNNPPNMS
jgi:hypothetical protein